MNIFKRRPTIPVVRLSGPIGLSTPLRPGLTIGAVAGPLERAFKAAKSNVVAILINSPGGSPVQSHLIYQRIRDLAKDYNRCVYVFAEDVAASGGYMIALAGDEIFADPSSIVGSIGVVSGGFGFDKLIDKIGIDRRVYTSGTHKSSLDPFKPEDLDDVAHLKKLQSEVHEVFKALVRERRASRLCKDETALFEGDFWSGQRALELGLIDGLAHVRGKMKELFGEKVRLKPIPIDRSWFRRRLAGFGPALGLDSKPVANWETSFSDELLSTLEARALWLRFGL